jgi:hypothetical protein
MVSALLLLLAAVVTLLGMAWFALAKEPHWAQVRSAEPLTPPIKNTLRGLGATSLAASFFICLFADHPTMAVLVWIMLLAFGALIVAFALSWRARWLRPVVAWVNAETGAP